MADDDTNETPDGTTVSVTVPEATEEAAPVAPVVVVADTGGSSTDDDSTDRWVELERWKVETEQSIRAAADEAWQAKMDAMEAKYQAEEATAEADFAESEVEELAEDVEEVEETIEDEIAPASTKVHPVFRPFRDWFPKRES